MGDIGTLAAALQQSDFGQWATASPIAYPAANVLHLFGLVMLIGGIGVLDLRLVGFLRTLPVEPMVRGLVPIAIAGFLLMAVSGTVLFAADATTLVASPVFRVKLVLIVVAIANALAFRFGRKWQTGDAGAAVPFALRAVAAASIILWLSALTAGRMIAYS